MLTRVHQENASHQVCRNSKEVAAVFPIHVMLIDQAQISLMHQRGRLQGVITTLLAQVVSGKAAEFVIHQRDQFGEDVLVAAAQLLQ